MTGAPSALTNPVWSVCQDPSNWAKRTNPEEQKKKRLRRLEGSGGQAMLPPSYLPQAWCKRRKRRIHKSDHGINFFVDVVDPCNLHTHSRQRHGFRWANDSQSDVRERLETAKPISTWGSIVSGITCKSHRSLLFRLKIFEVAWGAVVSTNTRLIMIKVAGLVKI